MADFFSDFYFTFINLLLSSETSVNIILDKKRRFQKIEGFGGAFTDAAGINIAKLPKSAQNNLLSSYFGPQSEQYSQSYCIDFN